MLGTPDLWEFQDNGALIHPEMVEKIPTGLQRKSIQEESPNVISSGEQLCLTGTSDGGRVGIPSYDVGPQFQAGRIGTHQGDKS